MKRALVVGVALLAFTGVAAAADLPPAPNYYKAPAYLPPSFSWTGFYAGINGGGGFGQSKWDSVGSFNTAGGLVGGTVGYNYQYRQAVFGIEGDVDWSGIRGSTGPFSTGDTWLSTVRGRIGYAADRFMPYITGGGAFGNINASSPFGSASATNAGWTVGAGLEFAFYGNWSAKAEYLYVSLGKFNCGIACGVAPDNVSFNTNLVRAGINYHF
jgi:outer membrane immunogenic protein